MSNVQISGFEAVVKGYHKLVEEKEKYGYVSKHKEYFLEYFKKNCLISGGSAITVPDEHTQKILIDKFKDL